MIAAHPFFDSACVLVPFMLEYHRKDGLGSWAVRIFGVRVALIAESRTGRERHAT